MKKLTLIILTVLFILGCLGCQRDAQVASYNLSYKADNFELNRRTVFYNGITGDYILVIQGRCSIEAYKTQLEVTCKVGDNKYKKHFLGLSDNVTYFSEQIDSSNVSTYQYKVLFKPVSIVPDIEVK